jgi:hypothetical protein
MRSCPECHSRRLRSSTSCASCFYRFTPADEARAALESFQRKCRLASIAAGLCVAILRYTLLR